MSNTINFRFRRKRTVEAFEGRGGHGAVNDCKRPSRGEGSRADLLEFHQEKMRLKGDRRVSTRMSRALAKLSAEKRRIVLSNFSRHPKGKKRTSVPRNSIWPESRTR